MSKVDRNNPQRSSASESSYSIMEFMREFPDDATCLEYLWHQRFADDSDRTHCPKCDARRKFHRVKSRPSYSCDTCGHHIHPTAGTIFHRSATSLHLWFYAMYLMTSTRCAISAKHLERELGVTYKTAWRMANLIRNEIMKQDFDGPLTGEVEADESWIGGKPKAYEIKGAQQRGRYAHDKKVPIFAAVQRGPGGKARAIVVPDSKAATLGPAVLRFIDTDARLITDSWNGYTTVGREYATHDTINHAQGDYVRGTVHTNTVEGFFGNVKRGISGNYHAVSPKWLQGYLNEFVWRYNHRDDGRAMFKTLLLRAAV